MGKNAARGGEPRKSRRTGRGWKILRRTIVSYTTGIFTHSPQLPKKERTEKSSFSLAGEGEIKISRKFEWMGGD